MVKTINEKYEIQIAHGLNRGLSKYKNTKTILMV